MASEIIIEKDKCEICEYSHKGSLHIHHLNTMYVLSGLFGNGPQVKIVETFAEYYDDTLSGSDIVLMTDVSKATVYSHINQLLKEGIIKKARKIGKTQLYQLNNNNPKAKIILMIERFIVAERLEKLVLKSCSP